LVAGNIQDCNKRRKAEHDRQDPKKDDLERDFKQLIEL
jgi:hypothetical protein